MPDGFQNSLATSVWPKHSTVRASSNIAQIPRRSLRMGRWPTDRHRAAAWPAPTSPRPCRGSHPFLQAIRRKLLTNNTPLLFLDEVEPALLHALVQVQLPEAALSLSVVFTLSPGRATDGCRVASDRATTQCERNECPRSISFAEADRGRGDGSGVCRRRHGQQSVRRDRCCQCRSMRRRATANGRCSVEKR